MTRNYKGLILIVFCLLLCFGIIYFCKTETKTISNKEIARTTVKFERDTLRLGQVVLGKMVPVAFRYTNTGNVPLLIKNVQTTCGCAEPTWEKAPLLPGKTEEIKVEFTGEHEGHFVKTIYVVCNIWKKVYPLVLIGDVVQEKNS